MDNDRRLAAMEARLHRMRLIFLGLCVCVLLIGTVAANGPFADLVCRSSMVKGAEGKTALEQRETGEIKAKDDGILAELEDIKKTVKNNHDATNKRFEDTGTAITGLKNSVADLANKTRIVVDTHDLGNTHRRGQYAPVFLVPEDTIGIWVQESFHIGQCVVRLQSVAYKKSETPGKKECRVEFFYDHNGPGNVTVYIVRAAK